MSTLLENRFECYSVVDSLIGNTSLFMSIKTAFIFPLLFWLTPLLGQEPLSLTLKQAEDLAIQNNYKINASWHRLEQGYYTYRASQGAFLPKLSFSAQAEVVKEHHHNHSLSNALRLTQPLYDSQASYNLEEARIQWEQLRLSMQQEICNVLLQVREAYDAMVLYRAQLAIDQSIIQIWEEELARQKSQVECGASTSFEMNQTQLNLKTAWIDFYETQKRMQTSQYMLLTVLGLPPQTPLHLQDNTLCLPVADWQQEDFQQWMQWAFCYRPELQLEEFNLRLAQNKVKQTKSENYPTISLYADAGHHYVNNGFGNQPRIGVGVNVDWTLLNFSTKQKVRAAQASRQEAASHYCQIELETEAVIYNEWNAIKQSYRAYVAAHEGALLAQEGIQMAKKKHQHGVMTAFEYRDAVKALREAEQKVNQATFDLRRAYYLLVRQAGVDLIPSS